MSHDEFQTFLRLLEALKAGKAAAPEYAKRIMQQAQLYREMALDEPTTLRKRLAELHSNPPMTDELAKFVAEIAKLVPSDPNLEFEFYQPAHDFFHFIRQVAMSSGSDQVHALVAHTLRFDWRVSRARLIEAMKLSDEVGFERRVRRLSDVLRDSIETWYRPILAAALQLSNLADIGVPGLVPSEVGALLHRCKQSSRIPDSILIDDARIIRNSVAHSQTLLDISAETVTYVNINRQGNRVEVGPMTWQVLVQRTDAFLTHVWALTIVLTRQRRLIQPTS